MRLGDVLGETPGQVIFYLGVLGMALSSITLQMICSGFVFMELFDIKFGSWKYRLATLIPTPGVLAPLLWKKAPFELAAYTNIICGLLLPVAYVGFIKLQKSRAYLGDDRPRGPLGNAWFAAMIGITAFLDNAEQDNFD